MEVEDEGTLTGFADKADPAQANNTCMFSQRQVTQPPLPVLLQSCGVVPPATSWWDNPDPWYVYPLLESSLHSIVALYSKHNMALTSENVSLEVTEYQQTTYLSQVCILWRQPGEPCERPLRLDHRDAFLHGNCKQPAPHRKSLRMRRRGKLWQSFR
jgi:hypothetical protein